MIMYNSSQHVLCNTPIFNINPLVLLLDNISIIVIISIVCRILLIKLFVVIIIRYLWVWMG